jgi:hypothetical protein
MKLCFRNVLLGLIAFVVSIPAMAGPSCDVRPNHPNCQPSDVAPGPVYKVTFSNIPTGTAAYDGIFTTPGTLDGEESGLNANGNGPNEVKLNLHDFLIAALGTEDIATCFPDVKLNGSIQMQDNSQSGGDINRVGYIWVHAFDANQNNMQYAIDLFNVADTWDLPLLPSGENEVSKRAVTHWELRRTKKKNVNECVSNGLVAVAETGLQLEVTVKESLSGNPYYPQ